MQPFVTLGDLIADLCLDLERFPIVPGSHQTLSGMTLGPGGAGNALITAARIGLPTLALGSVGDDWTGERVLACLDSEGVDVTAVARVAAPTRTATRLRAATGEQVFMGRPGGVLPAPLPEAWRRAIDTAGVLLVDGWSYFHDTPEVILQGVARAVGAGVPVLFDPGPRVEAIDREWLRTITRAAAVILVTEPEHQALARRLDLNDLRGLSALRALIQKHGAAGCVISAGATRLVCPAYPVDAVDATGAGDCFAAGVGWGLLTRQPWEIIGAVANAVGAAKAMKIGTALVAPDHDEVSAVLRAHRPDLARLFEWAGPA